MNFIEREKLVSRIITGVKRVSLTPFFYWIKAPTYIQDYISCEIYDEILKESIEAGIPTSAELLEDIKLQGLWTLEEDKEIITLEKNIENLKLKYYEMFFKKKEKETAKKLVQISQDRYYYLLSKKSAYEQMSAEGQALQEKHKYIIGVTTYHADLTTPVWPGDNYKSDDTGLLESVLSLEINDRIPEHKIRELARTDPWRSIWAGREVTPPIFSGINTIEQKLLLMWTRGYDNAYENPERPSNEIIEDDLAFDGWWIHIKRKREKEEKEANKMTISNKKIAEAQEVFIIAKDKEEIEEVEGLNDEHMAALKKQRMNFVEKKGIVQEAEMPDSKQEIYMKFTEMQRQRGK